MNEILSTELLSKRLISILLLNKWIKEILIRMPKGRECNENETLNENDIIC